MNDDELWSMRAAHRVLRTVRWKMISVASLIRHRHQTEKPGPAPLLACHDTEFGSFKNITTKATATLCEA